MGKHEERGGHFLIKVVQPPSLWHVVKEWYKNKCTVADLYLSKEDARKIMDKLEYYLKE